MIVSTAQTAAAGFGAATWAAVGALLVIGAFMLGYGLASTTLAVQKRRGDGAQLSDIAAESGIWLQRLERRSTGHVHDIIYKALRDASVDKLDEHVWLCKEICKRIDQAHSLRLLKTGGRARRRFWAETYGISRYTLTPPSTITDIPAVIV